MKKHNFKPCLATFFKTCFNFGVNNALVHLVVSHSVYISKQFIKKKPVYINAVNVFSCDGMKVVAVSRKLLFCFYFLPLFQNKTRSTL